MYREELYMIGMITGLAGVCLIGTGATIQAGKYIKNRRTNNAAKYQRSDDNMSLSDRSAVYTTLFTNMGLMKNTDWIKTVKYDNKECYTKTRFTISDSLSLSTFQKSIDDLKQKLNVPHLEIFNEKGSMVFRCRKEDIPLPPYEYVKTKQTEVRLGLDLDDKPIIWDLKSDTHCGVFANNGSGKSRQVHGMILHIIQNIPTCKLYLIDLKNGMELGRYRHLKNTVGFAKNVEDAKQLIADLEVESERRYAIMEEAGYSDYNEYLKDKPRTRMTRCFIFIDEIADLMDDKKAKKNEEGYDAVGTLKRLARKIRAVGMHLCVATQRPTVDFIDAGMKANLGCIIGMRVMNQKNSQLIIDENGLEELQKSQCIGKTSSRMVFFRSFFVSNEAIDRVISTRLKNFKEEYVEDPEVQNDSDKLTDKKDTTNAVDVEYEEVFESSGSVFK